MMLWPSGMRSRPNTVRGKCNSPAQMRGVSPSSPLASRESSEEGRQHQGVLHKTVTCRSSRLVSPCRSASVHRGVILVAKPGTAHESPPGRIYLATSRVTIVYAQSTATLRRECWQIAEVGCGQQ